MSDILSAALQIQISSNSMFILQLQSIATTCCNESSQYYFHTPQIAALEAFFYGLKGCVGQWTAGSVDTGALFMLHVHTLQSDMCHGKKSRSKILKVPHQVYNSGPWVPKVPRQVYISGSWVPKVPCQVHISGSRVSRVPRPVYPSGSKVPKVPRQVYIPGSWVPKVP